jgi:hypothetical protein
MPHPLVLKIVEHGLHSVKVDMLSPELRTRLLTEAGAVLLHENRPIEAAKAFALAENHDQLHEQGRWFLEQHKPEIAAHFLLHVAREGDLRRIAEECMNHGHHRTAQMLYEKLGDSPMAEFIKANFVQAA